MGNNVDFNGNTGSQNNGIQTGFRQQGKELEESDDMAIPRKRKTTGKKKKIKGSRYRNTAVEEIYLQRLSASVTKPVKKPQIDKDF